MLPSDSVDEADLDFCDPKSGDKDGNLRLVAFDDINSVCCLDDFGVIFFAKSETGLGAVRGALFEPLTTSAAMSAAPTFAPVLPMNLPSEPNIVFDHLREMVPLCSTSCLFFFLF